MRKVIPTSFFQPRTLESLSTITFPHLRRSLPNPVHPPSRSLAQVQSNHERFPESWHTNSGHTGFTSGDANNHLSTSAEAQVAERTLKLGKTIRILQSRLPTLLASPLPQEILSPHISLHLFPSTHPHLPTVSGRVAYHAALWTAPIAWSRVPIVGNVKLIILSERMVKNEPPAHGGSSHAMKERLVVRWKTCGNPPRTKVERKMGAPNGSSKNGSSGGASSGGGGGGMDQLDRITEWLGRIARDDEEFCGLFIFEFDEEGRVLRHIIEHAEESGSWDRASKVVSATDWLLGKAKRKEEKEVVAGLAAVGCLEYAPRKMMHGRNG